MPTLCLHSFLDYRAVVEQFFCCKTLGRAATGENVLLALWILIGHSWVHLVNRVAP